MAGSNEHSSDELKDVINTLVDTYLAKVDKPTNNIELTAYNKRVAKLKEVATNKITHIIRQKELEARMLGISHSNDAYHDLSAPDLKDWFNNQLYELEEKHVELNKEREDT